MTRAMIEAIGLYKSFGETHALAGLDLDVSSAFVPTDTMPDWMRIFAEHQPMTLVVNAVRDLTLGTNLYAAGLPSVIWSVAILVVSFPLGLWLYNRRTTQ